MAEDTQGERLNVMWCLKRWPFRTPLLLVLVLPIILATEITTFSLDRASKVAAKLGEGAQRAKGFVESLLEAMPHWWPWLFHPIVEVYKEEERRSQEMRINRFKRVDRPTEDFTLEGLSQDIQSLKK